MEQAKRERAWKSPHARTGDTRRGERKENENWQEKCSMQERWKEKRPFLKLGFNWSSVGSTISMKSQFIWKRKREPFHTPLCTISRLDASKRLQPTKDLRFENENVPVSVSLADTLNRNPEHICRKDPEELVRKFWEAIVRRAAAIREEIQRYIPKDFELRILEF